MSFKYSGNTFEIIYLKTNFLISIICQWSGNDHTREKHRLWAISPPKYRKEPWKIKREARAVFSLAHTIYNWELWRFSPVLWRWCICLCSRSTCALRVCHSLGTCSFPAAALDQVHWPLTLVGSGPKSNQFIYSLWATPGLSMIKSTEGFSR